MFAPTTKILVIDDMLTMRAIVKKTLQQLGLTAAGEAANGQAAWETLEKAHAEGKPYELVLSDWNMPQMTGLQLLKKVRADERFKTLPLLLITAESEQSQIVEAIKAGVTHYIVKPFTADTLKQRLEAAYAKVIAGNAAKAS